MFAFYWYCYIVGGAFIANQRINPATGEIYNVAEIISVAQASMMSTMTFG